MDIFEACKEGNLVEIPKLLEAEGFDINATDAGGMTPLLIAAQNGHLDVVTALLTANANPDIAITDNGATPLLIAAQNGHANIVTALLEADAAVDKATNNGETPLLVAVERGHANVVTSLLEDGAAVDKEHTNGETPLYIAAHQGHASVVTALLKANANPNIARTDNDSTPLYIAAQKGHAEVIAALLTAKANPDEAVNNGATPLLIAAQNGHLDVVTALLEANAAVDKAHTNGATALCIAAARGHADIVTSLLEDGAAVDKVYTNGTTPLLTAAHQGHANVVTALLTANANPNIARTDNGATPLLEAAQNGHANIVTALLATDADPTQARTNDGSTPLFTASMNGHLDVVDLLADKLLKDANSKIFSHPEFSSLCEQYKMFHDAGDDDEATSNFAEAIKRIIHNPDLDVNRHTIYASQPVGQAILDIYPQDTRRQLLVLEIKKLLEIKKPKPNIPLAQFLLQNMPKEEQEYFSKDLFLEKQKIMLLEIEKSEPNIALLQFLLATMSQEGKESFHQGQEFSADGLVGEYHGTTPIIDAARNLGPKTTELIGVLINYGASIDVHEFLKKSPFTYLVQQAWDLFRDKKEQIKYDGGMDTTADGSNKSGGGSAAEDASSDTSTESKITNLRDEIEKMLRPALNFLLHRSFNGISNGHKLSAIEIIDGAPKSSAEELREFCEETGIKLLDLKGVEAELRFHDVEKENTTLEAEVATLQAKEKERDQRLERLEAKVAELTAAMRKPRPTEKEYDVPSSEVVGDTPTSSAGPGDKRNAPELNGKGPAKRHDSKADSTGGQKDGAAGGVKTPPATTTSPTTKGFQPTPCSTKDSGR